MHTYIPLSISCPPCMTNAPLGFLLICNHTGDMSVNLLPKVLAMSYP